MERRNLWLWQKLERLWQKLIECGRNCHTPHNTACIVRGLKQLNIDLICVAETQNSVAETVAETQFLTWDSELSPSHGREALSQAALPRGTFASTLAERHFQGNPAKRLASKHCFLLVLSPNRVHHAARPGGLYSVAVSWNRVEIGRALHR